MTSCFPSVVGGVVHAMAVSNGATRATLADAYAAEQAAVRGRIGETPLSELPSLAAWRRVFSSFGVEPTKYRSAAEALLRRLTKQGEIPSINALVDLGNLVSVRYALPVAVLDLRDVTGCTTVTFADGSERFTDLGSDEIASPEPGEVVFVDEAGLASARRWCWRQSSQSAAGAGTTEVLITVEGHHPDALADVSAAVADLCELLAVHQAQAHVHSAILDASRPAFAAA